MTTPTARRRPSQVRKLVEDDEVLLTFQLIGTPPNAAVHLWLVDGAASRLRAQAVRRRLDARERDEAGDLAEECRARSGAARHRRQHLADRLSRQQAAADNEVRRRALGTVRPHHRGHRRGRLIAVTRRSGGDAKHRTSDVQLHIGNLEIPGSRYRAPRNDGVRGTGADDDKPAKKSAKRKPADPDRDGPRERKPRVSRSGSKRRSKGRSRGGIARLFYWGAVLGLWAGIAVVGVIVWAGAHLPPIQQLEIPKRPPTIQITGADGSVLATRGEMAGANVSLKDLPPYLPKAFIAIEDRRFYSHYGVDPIGILRAAIANILHRGVSQGGSTLTQQLAKNLFLTQERTLQRKLQEAELAIWLERKHSKAEILELYLNRVYFGSGAYGVEAAAQRYFGKSAKNVTIAEAAMLAGLVKSPSRLAPNRNPEGAEKRAQVVLAAMAEAKFITEAQAQASIGHPAYNVKAAGAGTMNYVADWIGEVLDDLVGQIDQDIVVETTIDPKLQAVAEAAVIDELAAKSVKFNVSQGALVAMTPDGAPWL